MPQFDAHRSSTASHADGADPRGSSTDDSSGGPPPKRVLVVICDALAAEVVLPAMKAGRLPTLASLAAAGVLREECTSIFPSITPAATAALSTGQYPDRSGIPGAFWYDREGDHLAYYGDDWKAIRNEGIDAYLRGFLAGLNYDHLRSDTVFESMRSAGRTAANFNLMWFRGPQDHALQVPPIFDWATSGDLPTHLSGPDVLVVGDFVAHDGRNDTDFELPTGGMTNRFGFNDQKTAHALRTLLDPARLGKPGGATDLTLAYFPDNDFESHERGPENALPVVEEVDRVLGDVISAYGGLEDFLRSFAVVMTGDHSQTRNFPPKQSAVDLNELTPGFNVVCGGGTFDAGNDVLIGTNMRSANVYFRDAEVDRHLFVKLALEDERIDQCVWRDGERIFVQTADRGELVFWPDAEGHADQYGGRWSFDGSLETVGGRVEVPGEGGPSRVLFGEYPNAFERLATGCFPLAGDLWVTVRPGYEFVIPETSVHQGGSHGSLHRLDSTAPLLAVGLETEVPEVPRIVDVVPMILEHFGIDSPDRPGAARPSAVPRPTVDKSSEVAGSPAPA